MDEGRELRRLSAERRKAAANLEDQSTVMDKPRQTRSSRSSTESTKSVNRDVSKRSSDARQTQSSANTTCHNTMNDARKIAAKLAGLTSLKSKKRPSDSISESASDVSFSDVSFASARTSSSSNESFTDNHESKKWGLRLKKRHKKSHSTEEEEFPILKERLNPELYENAWLDAQESSITQLLNEVLENDAPKEVQDRTEIQKELLQMYAAEPFPLIHKRLQASLLYGALAVPKEVLDKTGKLAEDLGLKRKFMDLFVETYAFTPLKAGLEVIVGRSCGENAEKATIERFLEKFFIRAEDSDEEWTLTKSGIKIFVEGDDKSARTRMLRTTILRSLLLMMMLDKAKNENHIDGCLFLTVCYPYHVFIYSELMILDFSSQIHRRCCSCILQANHSYLC